MWISFKRCIIIVILLLNPPLEGEKMGYKKDIEKMREQGQANFGTMLPKKDKRKEEKK